MNGEYTKFKNLKHLISIGLTLGVILGFIFGLVKALLFINANRYFELGFYNIAFSSFWSIVNYFSLIFIPSILIILLTIFFVYFVLTTFLKDAIKANRYIYYTVVTIILIGLFLIAGHRLNKSPWFPDFFSVKGFFYNIIVTISFVFLGFMVFKLSPRIYGFLSLMVPKIFHFSFFRFTLITLFLLLVLNSFFYYRQLETDKKGLNVLFITVDTLRADHLGSYGYVRDTSPNTDKLAKEGILFSQAVVQWPKTRPSLTSMLTSTYGYYNGEIRFNDLRRKVNSHLVLLPEILKNASYNTVAIVSNGNLAAEYNFNQGIDTHIEVWREHKNKEANYVTEYALSWLKENSSRGKFFMWIHYVDPHAKYQPPEPYHEMYVGDKFYYGSKTIPINNNHHEERNKDMGGIWPERQLGNHQELDYYIAQYDAEIRYTDENVGKVLDAVKALGLSDNTIIIFTADHGESLGEHDYYFDHGRLPYDTCVRVPLIIKVPGLKSGIKVIDHPVELIDMMPTVLDILSIPVNKEAQGKSLLPLMLGDDDGISEYAFTEAGYKQNYQRMIRTKKWKLIYVPDKEDQNIMQGMPFELYDMERDPWELNNLVKVETNIADELKRELFKWMERAEGVNGRSSRKENVSIDKKTEENLKSLGYIE